MGFPGHGWVTGASSQSQKSRDSMYLEGPQFLSTLQCPCVKWERNQLDQRKLLEPLSPSLLQSEPQICTPLECETSFPMPKETRLHHRLRSTDHLVVWMASFGTRYEGIKSALFQTSPATQPANHGANRKCQLVELKHTSLYLANCLV